MLILKNKNYWGSIKHAIVGLVTAIKNEKIFKFYFINLLVFIPINIIVRLPLFGHLLCLVCAMGVLAAECFNTVAERICYFITEEYNEKIKVIKDVAAAGVLCWGITFYVSEIALIISSILLNNV